MLGGPMEGVWEFFEMLQGDFLLLLTSLGVVLTAAAGIYGVYLTWRKYRMAMSKI